MNFCLHLEPLQQNQSFVWSDSSTDIVDKIRIVLDAAAQSCFCLCGPVVHLLYHGVEIWNVVVDNVIQPLYLSLLPWILLQDIVDGVDVEGFFSVKRELPQDAILSLPTLLL